MSSGSIFLRRFAKKETERKRNSDAFQGRRRRKKMMRTKSNVNAFVFGEEARRDFGEEKEKNEEGGGGTITMKSIESNVSKLERMTPVFSRELMAFVSGNKSELYEKRRKRNVAEAVVAKRGKEEDFRQPTSQFLSVFSVGSRNSSGSENMVLSLTDESCIRPSELAKKHFPAVMNAMREVNGMNVRVVALRPSYRYEEKKKKKKMKTSKTTKKNSAENDDDDDDDDDDDSNYGGDDTDLDESSLQIGGNVTTAFQLSQSPSNNEGLIDPSVLGARRNIALKPLVVNSTRSRNEKTGSRTGSSSAAQTSKNNSNTSQ